MKQHYKIWGSLFGLCILAAWVFIWGVMMNSTQEKILLETIPPPKNLVEGLLSNGLRYRILTVEDPSQQAHIALEIGVGGLHDGRARGLAHLLEHMVFNGTQKHPKRGEYVNLLQESGIKFGSHNNAYTTFTQTSYVLDGRFKEEKFLSLGLEFLSQMGFFALLREEDLKKELDIVLRERADRKLYVESYWRTLGMLKDGDFDNEDFLVIGSKASLSLVDRQTLKDFYQFFYRPDNMRLTVVGDVDVQLVEQKNTGVFCRRNWI